MQLRHHLNGAVTASFLSTELRILSTAERLRESAIAIMGKEPGDKYLREQIDAYRVAEAKKLADEAEKAGAEESARPILANTATVETPAAPAPQAPAQEAKRLRGEVREYAAPPAKGGKGK